MTRGLTGRQLKFLSEEEIRKIHEISLRILEEVGVKSTSKRILEVLSRSGIDVNVDKGIARISRSHVEEALKKAPKRIVIYGRSQENAVILENGRVYFGLGGTPTPYILDVESGEFRRPGVRDVAEATRLGDSLSNIDFIMTIAGAFDVPYEVEYLYEWKTILSNTSKPIVYPAPGIINAEKVVRMGIAIAGNEDEFRRKPIFGVYVEMPSPLTLHDANENIIVLAEKEVPIVIGQMPQLGATAPVTFAGAAALSNAENLAALTLTQIINPGAPFIYGGYVTLMDQKTGRCAYGAPEFAMGNIVDSALATYYGLPCFGWGGCSDSKEPDVQAGVEVMMNSLVAALSGVNLIHDFGYLAGGSVGSMEMAVIGNEVAGMIKRILMGIKVDDEDLAFNVVKDIGPSGHFLSHPHTLKHLRSEIYMPEIFNRDSEAKWIRSGKPSVRNSIKRRVREILKTHNPEPLPEDIQRKIEEIIRN
ncbi:MAG: trimethylamine methyltransferase family protein [Candidatus Methanomethylicia archaeon]